MSTQDAQTSAAEVLTQHRYEASEFRCKCMGYRDKGEAAMSSDEHVAHQLDALKAAGYTVVALPGYSLMAAKTLEVLQANGFKFVKLEMLRANGFELVNRRSLVEMQDDAHRRMLDVSLTEARYHMGRADALRDVLAAMTELNTRTTP